MLALALLVAWARPAAAGECRGDEATDVELVIEVLAVLDEVDGSHGTQLLRVEIVEVVDGDATAGDQVVLRWRVDTELNNTPPLLAGRTYRLAAASVDAGVLRSGVCYSDATETTAEVDDDGAPSTSRSVGMVTMTIAVLGIGFAYIRTRRRVSHWD